MLSSHSVTTDHSLVHFKVKLAKLEIIFEFRKPIYLRNFKVKPLRFRCTYESISRVLSCVNSNHHSVIWNTSVHTYFVKVVKCIV